MNIPKGFVLVPSTMLLSKEVVELIAGHCGDGDQMFGEYTDGLLWVGELEGDHGEKTHGLHIMTEEYPEEGSSTLVEFEAPKPTAFDEAKERELFEAVFPVPRGIAFRDGEYHLENGKQCTLGSHLFYLGRWSTWKACAQSRAQRGEV